MSDRRLQPLTRAEAHPADDGHLVDTRRTPARPRGRRTLAALVATVVLVTGWAATQPVTRPAGPTTGTSGVAPPSRAPAINSPERPVTYQHVAGLQLPISPAAGPRTVTDGRATGFAHTDLGAAFAAVHLLTRTFPFVGSAVFGPTITEQVVGPDTPALARLTADAYDQAARAAKVRDGGALGSDGGWVAGYRLDPPDRSTDPSRTVTVAVLLHQSDGQDGDGFVEYRVQVTWQDGDWRLIAPAWGDWRTAARATTSADRDLYRTYDEPADPASPTDENQQTDENQKKEAHP